MEQEIANLSQFNNISEQLIGNAINSTTSNISKIVSALAKNLFQQLKPILYIILAILIIYVIYKIYRFFSNIIRERRIKLTYYNTEKILSKLDAIEKKLGIREKSEERATETREEKADKNKEKKTKK